MNVIRRLNQNYWHRLLVRIGEAKGPANSGIVSLKHMAREIIVPVFGLIAVAMAAEIFSKMYGLSQIASSILVNGLGILIFVFAWARWRHSSALSGNLKVPEHKKRLSALEMLAKAKLEEYSR